MRDALQVEEVHREPLNRAGGDRPRAAGRRLAACLVPWVSWRHWHPEEAERRR